MGDRRSISLIQVADSRFLVGNTAHQINLLTALPDTFSLGFRAGQAASRKKYKKSRKESRNHFRKLFEAEKRTAAPQTGHPLPEDLRTKMRQLTRSSGARITHQESHE